MFTDFRIIRWALDNLDAFSGIANLALQFYQATTNQQRGEVLKQLIDLVVPLIDTFQAVQPLAADCDLLALENQLLAELQAQANAQGLGGPRDGRWLRAGLDVLKFLLPLLTK